MNDSVERICFGLEPQEFQLVFNNQDFARTITGGNFTPLIIRRYKFFLSDYAIYQEARTLAELMYQCLYEPSTFQDPKIHANGSFFSEVRVEKGAFIVRRKYPLSSPQLNNMPSIIEMREVLRDKRLNYDTRTDTLKPLAKLLNLVLKGEAPNPDEVLIQLL